MIAIRGEIARVEAGEMVAADSPLRHAPHTADTVCADTWDRVYSRHEAAYPAPTDQKYWPPVGRIDNAFGDRNLMCACPPWPPAE